MIDWYTTGSKAPEPIWKKKSLPGCLALPGTRVKQREKASIWFKAFSIFWMCNYGYLISFFNIFDYNYKTNIDELRTSCTLQSWVRTNWICTIILVNFVYLLYGIGRITIMINNYFVYIVLHSMGFFTVISFVFSLNGFYFMALTLNMGFILFHNIRKYRIPKLTYGVLCRNHSKTGRKLCFVCLLFTFCALFSVLFGCFFIFKVFYQFEELLYLNNLQKFFF